jgi:hypothetical protein
MLYRRMKTQRRANATLRRSDDGAGLSPAQEAAVTSLLGSLTFGRISVIWGDSGFGKTTMLQHLRRTKFRGAPLLSTTDFLATMGDRHPLGMEEAYARLLLDALRKHPAVLVDDLHLFSDAVCCNYMYPRKGYFDGPLTAVITEAVQRDRQLVFTSRGGAPVQSPNAATTTG